MSWISERLNHRPGPAKQKRPKADETLFDAGAIQRWIGLVTEYFDRAFPKKGQQMRLDYGELDLTEPIID